MPAMENIAGNFFLIGLMGAGKTTLGRQLAEQLDYTFYDSDAVICERTGVSIPTIFELEGEDGFRMREAAVIRDLCALSKIVLATGGGSVLKEENRQCLKRNGTVIYLHTQPEVLFERVRYDKNRPLLQVENPLEKLNALYAQRDSLYRETADFVIEAGQRNHAQALQQIMEAIR
jgi:shikimate kinase